MNKAVKIAIGIVSAILLAVLFIFAMPKAQTPQVKQVKANIQAMYPGKVKFVSVDQYDATAGQQVVLYYFADEYMSDEDQKRYEQTPDAIVGEVVEVYFTHGGNKYQYIQYYEDGAKKFNYLQEVLK